MSLLSQFFPGGGGLKVDFVLVGGGGGGGSRGGCGSGCCSEHAAGGGGGQVVIGEDYSVTPGQSYTITIGAGGAGGCLIPSPTGVPTPYNPTRCTQNFSGKPGSPGGVSCFGSVTARGGGGGGGAFNPYIASCLAPSFPGLARGGCPGGSGGGANGVAYYPQQAETGGVAVGNYSVGNYIKFGGNGKPSKNNASLYTSPTTTPCYPYVLVYAGGGGGAGASANATSGGGPITLIGNCPWCIANSPVCNSPTGYVPSCFVSLSWKSYEGSLSVSSGGAEPFNVVARNNPLDAHRAGQDGYVTNILGTDCYFGGGGEAFGGQARTPYLTNFTALHPTHPNYPTSSCKRLTVPSGSCGGGAYRNVVGSGFNPYTCFLCYWRSCNGVYGGAITYVPTSCTPCYCLFDAVTGQGGGGASSNRGYVNTTTGPCASNLMVADGTNGSSGTLIIRYPTAYAAATVSGNTPVTPVPGYYIYRWNGPGSITFN